MAWADARVHAPRAGGRGGVSTWHPMRSAPKGGAPFLCCGEREDGELGWAVCYLSVDRMLCFDATGGFADEGFRPTHWMPLPEPPLP